MVSQPTADLAVYVGTYTRSEPRDGRRSEGIYVFRMNPATGALTPVQTVAGIQNPSYLAIAPSGGYLYAVNEVAELDGQPSGGISAFAIDPRDGTLRALNRQLSGGAGPCHVSVEPNGAFVLVANYLGGSVAILPIQSDGSLGAATHVIQHEGSSVNPNRQGEPHAHSINVNETSNFALAADLGIDKVLLYQINSAEGRLVPNNPPSARLHAGAGPRHLDFHPSGRFVYVINELDSTITAFAYNAANGTLREIHSVPTLPEGFHGTSYCADIHVAPSGKFVYGSNRGHDSIVIFAIDEETGRLSYVGHESTQGRTPRNFVIDPSGTFLLAANQSTNTIVTFRIDGQTGKLAPTDHVAGVPSPVCLKFVPSAS